MYYFECKLITRPRSGAAEGQFQAGCQLLNKIASKKFANKTLDKAKVVGSAELSSHRSTTSLKYILQARHLFTVPNNKAILKLCLIMINQSQCAWLTQLNIFNWLRVLNLIQTFLYSKIDSKSWKFNFIQIHAAD